jgi:hypothetical protein
MFPIDTIMMSLAQSRPIFHAEADFQHAFAWELHKLLPDAQVRLELPVVAGGETMRVDIWATVAGRPVAIELKYKKRALDVMIGAERFLLRNDSAQDLGRYDFIKDIERIERIAAHIPQAEGYAVLLTNDSGYWREGTGLTIDNAFRLHEGRGLTGDLGWGSAAGKGTTAGREQILRLNRTYPLGWKNYSQVGTPPALFCCLMIHVPAEG